MLIEQSIAKQYGVLPSEQGSLKYSDWAKMVGGLMKDTPLGQTVLIRSESDPEVLKYFTPEQMAVRRKWHGFQMHHTPKLTVQEQRRQIDRFEKMFASMFGKKGG